MVMTWEFLSERDVRIWLEVEHTPIYHSKGLQSWFCPFKAQHINLQEASISFTVPDIEQCRVVCVIDSS